MLEGKSVGVILAAAGSGSRMETAQPKQLTVILGKPVILYSLEVFQQSRIVDAIVIVTRREDIHTVCDISTRSGLSKVIEVVEGGQQRQDSVWNGIQKFRTPPFDILLVHDAARPFISPRIIEGIAQAALRNGAAVAAVRPTDTVKLSKDGDFVEETVDRQGLWLVQTPQGFRSDILVRSHEHARGQGFYGTDDSVLVERMGQKVRIVESDARNMKITTPLDMVIAEEIAGKYFRKEEGS